MEETLLFLQNEQERFFSQQIQDEITLSEKIDDLVDQITNIALQTDVNKVQETAIEVKRIWKTMKECQVQGLLLNERQKFFGVSVIPFEHLNKLMKEFEPYQSLWITAAGISLISSFLIEKINILLR